MNTKMKSGFIAIVGRPNVGKSTLMNKLINEKLAIISDISGTTRERIRGICNIGQNQYIFLDTPGIHKPKHLLGQYMTDTALETLSICDVILFVLDGLEMISTGDRFVYENIKASKKPYIIIINKSDKMTDDDIIEKQKEIDQNFSDYVASIPITAQYSIGINKVLDLCSNYLSSDFWYYPEDYYTDMPVNRIVVEIVREKILHLTREEIPHSVVIEITDVLTKKDIRHYNITIYVERNSQKGIIIGENGKLIKKIGILARKDIERLIDKKVNLQLWVKVRKNWRKDKKFLEEMGYEVK